MSKHSGRQGLFRPRYQFRRLLKLRIPNLFIHDLIKLRIIFISGFIFYLFRNSVEFHLDPIATEELGKSERGRIQSKRYEMFFCQHRHLHVNFRRVSLALLNDS